MSLVGRSPVRLGPTDGPMRILNEGSGHVGGFRDRYKDIGLHSGDHCNEAMENPSTQLAPRKLRAK